MKEVSPYHVSPYLRQPLRSYEQAFREVQARRLRRVAREPKVIDGGQPEPAVRREVRLAGSLGA